MKTQYHSMTRTTRSLAAMAAITTVVALFNFVAGLGDTKAEAMAGLRAQSVMTVASVKPATDASTVVVQ